MKMIRVSNLVYEMLQEVARKQRPTKPESLVEELIEDAYRRMK
tara:strand:- start:27 stop:155 length:129 start_codon:yes stop_codon:yes gene_type:complete